MCVCVCVGENKLCHGNCVVLCLGWDFVCATFSKFKLFALQANEICNAERNFDSQRSNICVCIYMSELKWQSVLLALSSHTYCHHTTVHVYVIHNLVPIFDLNQKRTNTNRFIDVYFHDIREPYFWSSSCSGACATQSGCVCLFYTFWYLFTVFISRLKSKRLYSDP